MAKYYYLISGLPELQLDDSKLKISLLEFKNQLLENLSDSDLSYIGYFYMQFDNKNLLHLLNNKDAELETLGNLDRDQLLDIILQFKETEEPADKKIHPYFRQFIPAFLADKPVFQHMSWEDQLATLYYNSAISCRNSFISDWFKFNLNVNNIIIAMNCRNFGYRRETMVVGDDDISIAIRTSNAKDFGIKPIFPEVDDVMRLADEPDLFERERRIDLLKWNWLEEKGFFHYFDMEHLFIYLVRLSLLERWVRLEKETGRKVFREMISQLQHSFEFPNEFTINRVK
ncbi:MAG: DUF2764 family protein [Bacteroidales bacterium]|nr:DUF2764 family protein [Bacteroidales bacterium]